MPLDIPLPTALPEDDPVQYIPLLLSAIEGFLQLQTVWSEVDYPQAYSYMEELKSYIIGLMSGDVAAMNVGAIQMFATANLPSGWLPCDGTERLRDEYPALFSAIGLTFGSPSDNDRFKLPDLRRKFPYGTYSGFVDIGDTGGESDVTLTVPQLPAHSHTITRVSGTGSVTRISVNTGLNSSITSVATNEIGGDEPHNNIPPYLALTFAVFAGL